LTLGPYVGLTFVCDLLQNVFIVILKMSVVDLS